jgi:hypothetical protein
VIDLGLNVPLHVKIPLDLRLIAALSVGKTPSDQLSGSHKSVLTPPTHVPSAAHDGIAAATHIATEEITVFNIAFLILLFSFLSYFD